jgi:zinc/manganese transport system substrate-binding protein
MKHLLLLAVALLIARPAAAADLRVVTTTTDLAALVKIIGGEYVEVEALCRGYQDPHHLEAKPSHMSRLRKADLVVYVGLELEVGWLPLLINGSRNPQLRLGEPGNLAMTGDIRILEIPTGQISRSEGDIHPLGNPHYWLDPRNEIVMAQTITDRLTQLTPDHADQFEAARAGFADQMTTAIAGWEERLAPWRGRPVVCYHTQWEYLVDWLGLTVTDYVENKPGIPPSPQHVRELRKSMLRDKVGLVMISNFFEPGPAEKIANDTGSRLIILPASVDGEDGLGDPFLLFEYLVTSIEDAFTRGGIDG